MTAFEPPTQPQSPDPRYFPPGYVPPQPPPRQISTAVALLLAAGAMVLVLLSAFLVALVNNGAGTDVEPRVTPADGDVTVLSCGIDETLGLFGAKLDVLNHGETAADYIIVVAFEAAGGGAPLHEALASADRLPPGATATVEAKGFQGPPPGTSFGCRVVRVLRTALG